MNSLYSTCTSSFFHHCFVYESLDFICACVDDRLSIDVDEKNNLDDNNDVDNDRYNNKDGKTVLMKELVITTILIVTIRVKAILPFIYAHHYFRHHSHTSCK